MRNGRNTGIGLWLALAIVIFLLLASVAVNFGFLASRSRGRLLEAGEDEFPRLREVWSYGSGDVKAARIAVEGPIFREPTGGLFVRMVHDRVELIIRQIRTARNDENVKAIILEMNSPGGELTASDELYQALLDFKNSRKDRQILAFVRSMAASAGYYISTSADWIIAEPTSILGSIGVIVQTLNISELSNKIGVTDITIKTGDNKDLFNPFREVSDEERRIMQSMVNEMHERFLGVILEGRPIERDTLVPIADGRIFTSPEALSYRLIDQIGYWDDAVIKTAELLGLQSVRVVRYEEDVGVFGMFSRAQASFSLSASLACPRLLSIWKL